MALLLLTHVALLGGGWLGYRRYHGSLSGGVGTIEDTTGLFQWAVGLKKTPWISFRGWGGGGEL